VFNYSYSALAAHFFLTLLDKNVEENPITAQVLFLLFKGKLAVCSVSLSHKVLTCVFF